MEKYFNEYESKAAEFLESADTSMEIRCLGCEVNPMWRETQPRMKYRATLKNGRGQTSVIFWDSLFNTSLRLMSPEQIASDLEEYGETWLAGMPERHVITSMEQFTQMQNQAVPGPCEILACLQKTDPGTFEDFCTDMGLDTDSRRAEKIWKACCREYAGLARIFTPEQMEALQDIV